MCVEHTVGVQDVVSAGAPLEQGSGRVSLGRQACALWPWYLEVLGSFLLNELRQAGQSQAPLLGPQFPCL